MLDTDSTLGQTVFMRIRRLIAVPFVIGAVWLSAQQPPAEAPPSASRAEIVKLTADISASYYHPDSRPGLDCGAVVDFSSLFKQLGQSPSGESMKALSGITIKIRAMRDHAPKIDIAWPDGAPASKEATESGLRQTLVGFFQLYWPFFASPINGGNSMTFRQKLRREAAVYYVTAAMLLSRRR